MFKVGQEVMIDKEVINFIKDLFKVNYNTIFKISSIHPLNKYELKELPKVLILEHHLIPVLSIKINKLIEEIQNEI
jgi:hypothetical protein